MFGSLRDEVTNQERTIYRLLFSYSCLRLQVLTAMKLKKQSSRIWPHIVWQKIVHPRRWHFSIILKTVNSGERVGRNSYTMRGREDSAGTDHVDHLELYKPYSFGILRPF